MAFSPDQVYQALNSYFYGQFNMGLNEGQIILRFGQSHIPITAADYATPNLAVENFSRMVNEIPIDKGNGVVFFSGTNSIDETYYYQLVTPATVVDVVNVASFGELRQQALDKYELVRLESSNQPGTQFRPSYAAPTDWYVPTNNGFWTSHNFTVTDPTAPAPDNTISISFDYGKVDITRPWFFEPFIQDNSCYIPGKYQGQLTTFNDTTTNLTSMPVGLIVIKNLLIQGQSLASGSPVVAATFGPFLVGTQRGNQLQNPEIQVIGWMLEKLPALPPQGDDSLPVRSYSLIDKAPSATWTSFINTPVPAVPPSYDPLVWGQPFTNVMGSAGVDEHVQLETGGIYKALRTFTMAGSYGSVKAVYPAFTLNGMGKFTAHIGFSPGAAPGSATNINILFQVFVLTPNTPTPIPNAVINETKSYTGMLTQVEADLSSYQNQSVVICLQVTNEFPSFGAMAYWVNPLITY